MSPETRDAKPYTAAEAKQQNSWARGLAVGLLATTTFVGAAYAAKGKANAMDWILKHGEWLFPGVGMGIVASQAARHHNDNAELIAKLEQAERHGRLGEELGHRPPPDFLPFKQNDPHLTGRVLTKGALSGAVGYTTAALLDFDENNPTGNKRWGIANALLGSAAEISEHLIHGAQHNRRAEILNHFQEKTGFAAREAARLADGPGLGR